MRHRVHHLLVQALAVVLSAVVPLCAHAQDAGTPRFEVKRYVVEGSSLLNEARVNAILAPFTGASKDFGDLQKALDALETRYRNEGYSAVQVFLPEQELTLGTVRFRVIEGTVGKIRIDGNTHFREANIRRSLPLLREGKVPNMRRLSESIQLANENPSKKIEVTLGEGEAEDKVDAKVKVVDESPHRFTLSLDNTGSASSGKHRMMATYQHANLFDRDHVVSVSYGTSPDQPAGVTMNVYSLGYRIPLYSLGDSIDLIYGHSSVDMPSNAPTLNGTLALVGKGSVSGLRYNLNFARVGVYSSKLVMGYDYKHMNTRCSFPNGQAYVIDPPTPTSPGCVPHTLRPLSANYSGQWQRGTSAIDISAGLAWNWGMGSRYPWNNGAGQTGVDRYSMIALARRVPDNFTVARFGASYVGALGDWQVRIAASGQHAESALPGAEQFGIAGSQAVRGFNERAVAADRGWFANTELYSPDLAPRIGLKGSNLRALVFYDLGSGTNLDTVPNKAATATPFRDASIASLGFGLRYALGKTMTLRADTAWIADAGPVNDPRGGPANTESRGDWRMHLGAAFTF